LCLFGEFSHRVKEKAVRAAPKQQGECLWSLLVLVGWQLARQVQKQNAMILISLIAGQVSNFEFAKCLNL